MKVEVTIEKRGRRGAWVVHARGKFDGEDFMDTGQAVERWTREKGFPTVPTAGWGISIRVS